MRANRFSIAIFSLIFLSPMFSDSSVWGEETSRREERRKKLPVEKLIQRLEDPAVIKRKQPDKVISLLGVKKGETVADIGAGTGTFTFRLADRVGADGKVYAVEIEDALLDFIRDRAAKKIATNVVPVKSSDSGPNLPPASCDKMVLGNSYEYLPDPVGFMKSVRQALKPGGSVAIVAIDRDKVRRKSAVNPKNKLYTPGMVTEEMKSAGFTLRESHDIFETYMFLIFEVPKDM